MIRFIERDPVAHDTAYEVLCDGHEYVSLQMWDATGDTTLVLMSRAKALLLAQHIVMGAEALPKKKGARK